MIKLSKKEQKYRENMAAQRDLHTLIPPPESSHRPITTEDVIRHTPTALRSNYAMPSTYENDRLGGVTLRAFIGSLHALAYHSMDKSPKHGHNILINESVLNTLSSLADREFSKGEVKAKETETVAYDKGYAAGYEDGIDDQ